VPGALGSSDLRQGEDGPAVRSISSILERSTTAAQQPLTSSGRRSTSVAVVRTRPR
jgi:hypothetical protein